MTPDPPTPVPALDADGRADYIAQLRESNRLLLAENLRLQGLLAADPQVLRDLADGLEVKHWAVKLLAFGFAEHFKSSGAKNFLVFDLHPPDMPALSVALQLKDRKSPAERIADLQEQVRTLEARLAAGPPA